MKMTQRMAAVEADVEEGVVNQAESFDGLKVFGIEAGGKHAHGHHPFLGYIIAQTE